MNLSTREMRFPSSGESIGGRQCAKKPEQACRSNSRGGKIEEEGQFG